MAGDTSTRFRSVRGFLVSVGLDPEILIEFQFNPAEFTDRRAVSYTTLNAPGLVAPVRQYGYGGDRTISFVVKLDVSAGLSERVQLDDNGGLTRELNKFRAFLYPQTERWKEAGASFLPLFRDSPRQFVAPPRCRFGFGDRADQGPTVIDCVMTEASINEQAFNERMAPVRAEVQVTLVELSPYGGEPGPAPTGG